MLTKKKWTQKPLSKTSSVLSFSLYGKTSFSFLKGPSPPTLLSTAKIALSLPPARRHHLSFSSLLSSLSKNISNGSTPDHLSLQLPASTTPDAPQDNGLQIPCHLSTFHWHFKSTIWFYTVLSKEDTWLSKALPHGKMSSCMKGPKWGSTVTLNHLDSLDPPRLLRLI